MIGVNTNGVHINEMLREVRNCIRESCLHLDATHPHLSTKAAYMISFGSLLFGVKFTPSKERFCHNTRAEQISPAMNIVK